MEGEAEVVDATTTTFDETGQGEFGFLDEVEPAVRTPAGGGTGTTASSGGTAAQLELPLGEGGTAIPESGGGQSGGNTIQIENQGTQGLTGQPGACINSPLTTSVAAETTATRATQLEFQFAKDVGSSDVTYLYQKVGAQGEHLKFGITDNPATRYTAAELNGGSLRIIGQGERSEMLSLERQLHETLPIGPEERQLFYIQKQVQKGLKPPPY